MLIVLNIFGIFVTIIKKVKHQYSLPFVVEENSCPDCGFFNFGNKAISVGLLLYLQWTAIQLLGCPPLIIFVYEYSLVIN